MKKLLLEITPLFCYNFIVRTIFNAKTLHFHPKIYIFIKIHKNGGKYEYFLFSKLFTAFFSHTPLWLIRCDNTRRCNFTLLKFISRITSDDKLYSIFSYDRTLDSILYMRSSGRTRLFLHSEKRGIKRRLNHPTAKIIN